MKTNCMPQVVALFCAISLSTSFVQAQESTDTIEVRVEGIVRHALVWQADTTDLSQKKAVFVFHGGGMNMYRMLDQFETELPNHPDYIFVFGQALNSQTSTNCFGNSYLTQLWQTVFPYVGSRNRCGIDGEVKYAKTLRDQVLADYNVYPDSAFAFGYSSGGFFTFSLMRLAPNYFNKFAVFGAVSNFYVDPASFDCSLPLEEMVYESQNELEGFNALSPPTLVKVPVHLRRPIYYLISQEDETIDDIVTENMGYPLFDLTAANDSWFRNTFMEALYINTNLNLVDAYNEYDAFLTNVAGMGAGDTWMEEYGSVDQVRIEVFNTSGGTNGHFMSNYPTTGIGGVLANMIDFFE